MKLWNTQSGFCFVTFSEHKSTVTDVIFGPNKKFVISASLDGTVRAFDLTRLFTYFILYISINIMVLYTIINDLFETYIVGIVTLKLLYHLDQYNLVVCLLILLVNL